MTSFTILGEAASKANSRRISMRGKYPRSIKSAKALAFEKSAVMQLSLQNKKRIKLPGDQLQEGDLNLICFMYYASRRPDLDDSLVCDCLQKAGVIKNDRQIKEKHLYWRLDKSNPRIELKLEQACLSASGVLRYQTPYLS